MADQTSTTDIGDGLEVEAKPKGGISGKVLILLGILPNLLLVGGVAGAYFSGLLDPLLKSETAVEQVAEAEQSAPPELVGDDSYFYKLPDLLVNLNVGGRKSAYLKLSVSLELPDDSHIDHLDRVRPRIIDSFQVYLRELRVEDLSGSAGIQRLREELLYRVNAAARPAVVRDVLFKEMLIQ